MPTYTIMRQKKLPVAVHDLESFLNLAEDLMHNIIYCWSGLLIEEKYRKGIENAWQEFVKEKAINGEGHFLWNIVTASEGYGSNGLVELGLDGSQLNIKMAGISGVLSKFVSSPSIELLEALFDWIISVLTSLARLNGLNIMDALKELFEAIQKFIKPIRFVFR